MKEPLFIILGGLPGVGKTSIARMLAAKFNAVYILIDNIEQSIINSCLKIDDIHNVGYLAGYLIAKDNPSVGNSVVADSVNPLEITRQAWRNCADNVSCNILEIELICSNQGEHRKRVESRKPDISNHDIPTWKEVIEREYECWDSTHIEIDTAARTPDEVFEHTLREIAKVIRPD